MILGFRIEGVALALKAPNTSVGTVLIIWTSDGGLPSPCTAKDLLVFWGDR